VTRIQVTKLRMWTAGVNRFRYEQREPERLGLRRWIVNCGRRSVMKTRQNEVADEPRRPPLDTVHRRGTTVQTSEDICVRWRHTWQQSAPTGAVTEDAMVYRPQLNHHTPVKGGRETKTITGRWIWSLTDTVSQNRMIQSWRRNTSWWHHYQGISRDLERRWLATRSGRVGVQYEH